MGIIREPLEVDFVFAPRPLTKDEKEKISSYIRQYKARHTKKTVAEKRRSRAAGLRKRKMA